MDELKKLARVWKLNERRNFWKQHFTKEALMGALLQHIHDNNSFGAAPPPGHQPEADEIFHTPMPPTELKPSHAAPESKLRVRVKMRRICGYPVLNPVRNDKDILTKSRFKSFPTADNSLSNQLSEWRTADFCNGSSSNNEQDVSASSGDTKVESSQAKLEKRRALALQLLEYSLRKKNVKKQMSRQNIETFLNVAETGDYESAEYSAAALSNICSNPQTRLMLIDSNAIHKYTALLPQLKTPAAGWAATLFFYYLSCEHDIEDRIYNAGFNTLVVNSTTNDFSLCAAALTGLSNLLPCSERHRVAEQIVRAAMRFGTAHLSDHPEQSRTILGVIQRATSFTNVHSTLLNLELMDFISLVVANQDRNDLTAGKLLSSILTNFLHSPDSYEDIIQSDYVHIFIELLGFEDDDIVCECLGALAVLSANPDSVTAVLERDVVEVVCGLTSFRDLTTQMAVYVAKYFANVCRPGLGNIQSVVDAGTHAALLQLLDRHYDVVIRNFTLRALRGILSVEAFCTYFCTASIPPLISAILTREELEAITCFQHISVVPSCLPLLFTHDVHANILSILHSDRLKQLSTTAVVGYLRIILQIAAGSPERAQALLRMRATECLWFVLQECSNNAEEEILVPSAIGKRGSVVSAEKKLSIRLTQMPEVCKIVSRVLVCLITAAGKDGSALQPDTRNAAIDVVKLISDSGAESVVIDECCLVLASVSAFGIKFSVAHPIIQNFLNCSSSDAMTESLSVVIYNLACDEENIQGMLDNNFYLNLMIRMMRSGLIVAQDNIVDAFRIMCCYPQCSRMLMKHELLSDLIVIALLRTSSEKIKTVCCEALYNMLCQSEDIRLNLLKGDLWWAIMRLSKTDIERVREVCCSALLNLSLERENIGALRRNHVISFLKEFTANGRGAFLEPCLITMQNILNNADTDMLHSELVMAVEVCCSVLSRCDTVLSISLSLNLIARILVTLSENNFGIAELSNCEMAKILWEARTYWQSDAKCRETVSFLLQIAVGHASFIASTPLSDMIPLCNILLYGPMTRKDFSRQHSKTGDTVTLKDPLHDAASISDSIIERENVASVLMRYMSYSGEANEVSLKYVIRNGLFHSAVAGPLCASRRQSISSRAGDLEGNSVEDPSTGDIQSHINPPESKEQLVVSKELRRTCVSVYAHAVPLLLSEAEAKMKDEMELRQYAAAKAGRQINEMTLADISFSNSWYGLLPIDLLSFYMWDADTLANICFIIGSYSKYRVLAGYLLDSNIYSFLASMMEIAFAEAADETGEVQHGIEDEKDNAGSVSQAFSLATESRKVNIEQSYTNTLDDINIDVFSPMEHEDDFASPVQQGDAEVANVWEDDAPSALVLAGRFSAAMLRSISDHPHLMPQVVSAEGIDRLLYFLIKLEDGIIARDLSILLYRSSNEELTPQVVLSPKVLYDIASHMSGQSFVESNLGRMYRHIVAVALENFAHDIGATPDHVKSVYDEMIENENFDISSTFREWIIDDGSLGLHCAVRKNIDPYPLEEFDLPKFPDISLLWIMVKMNERKHLDSIEFSSQANVDSEETGEEFFSVIEYSIEQESALPLMPYAKITCVYPFVDTTMGMSGPAFTKRTSVARMTSHFDPFASFQSVGSSVGEFGSFTEQGSSTIADDGEASVKQNEFRQAGPVTNE